MKIECGAHHEAAHIVIAAILGLTLRPDGLLINLDGDGLSVYSTLPEDTDSSREAVILASEAGYWADLRFCAEHSCPGPDANGCVMYFDHVQSREIATKLSTGYLAGEPLASVYMRLQNESKRLVDLQWPVIEAIAAALLAKKPQPMRSLKTGEPWINSTAFVRYLDGGEIVEILARHGIAAICKPREP